MDNTVAAQITILWDNDGGSNLTNTSYALRTAEFTCTSSGTYYFAFNCYSDADMYNLYVDEVTITSALAGATADFSASYTYADTDQTLIFTDASGGGAITSWSWDFGEGAVPATADSQGPHNVYYTTTGFKTVSLTINGSNATTKTDYIIIDHLNTPRQLTATPSGLADVDLSWLSPELNEGFEPYENFDLSFGGYTQIDLDGSPTYGISGVSFTNSYYTGSFIIFNPSQTFPASSGIWDPYAGYKYAACFAATTPPNNDWLITPKMTITSGEQLTFWAKSVVDSYGLERFKIGISTTGTQTTDFTIISSGPYVEAPIDWTEYTYDLSSYDGQKIYIAINCVSNDAFCFMLDDIKVTDGSKGAISKPFVHVNEKTINKPTREKPTGPSVIAPSGSNTPKSFGFYKVYRDGEEIANINDFSYTDPDVIPGTYVYTVTELYVDPDAESLPAGPAEVTLIGTWTGAINNDWENPGNWVTVKKPLPTAHISIPETGVVNFPVVTAAGTTCKNLTIYSNAKLTINPTATMTIAGTLTNDAGESGLIIKSDASGTGSLISSTTGVDAKVEQYLTKMKWHFIGMPVENGVAGVFHLPSGHSDIYLRTHIESTNSWSPYIEPVTYTLIQGRGYETWVGNTGFNQDETIVFPGKLGAGNYTTGTGSFYPLEYTSGHGLNLICNPYPSALQSNINSWSKSNIANSVWTWSDVYGNYVYWNGSNGTNGNGYGTMTGGIIPAMQGFFVEATGTNPSLTIPQSDRVHSSQSYYKESEIPLNTLRFDVDGNGYHDALFIRSDANATEDYNPEMDAQKLFGLDYAPQLYTLKPENKLSINAIPDMNSERIVEMGFECSVPGQFVLEVSGLDGLDENAEVYLEDLKEGIIHNLKENPVYSFTHGLNADPNRFLIHFGNPNAIAENIPGMIKIYTYNEEVYIQNPEHRQGEVFIYDLMGRMIAQKELKGEGKIQMNINSGTGFYLVTVQTGDELTTEKVFIK